MFSLFVYAAAQDSRATSSWRPSFRASEPSILLLFHCCRRRCSQTIIKVPLCCLIAIRESERLLDRAFNQETRMSETEESVAARPLAGQCAKATDIKGLTFEMLRSRGSENFDRFHLAPSRARAGGKECQPFESRRYESKAVRSGESSSSARALSWAGRDR